MEKKRQDIEINMLADQEEYDDLPGNISEKLSWFQDQKLGIIFHWGLYAEAGIVESWQLSEEDEWARKKGAWREDLDTLRKEYWSLNRTFNPTKFNPSKWAEESVNAGFKYMIFTTKHHDGFSMFDTKYSDYKISGGDSAFASNPKSNVFKEVAAAFREKGVSVGAYYSKPDWHSPYYWLEGDRPVGRYASYDPLEKPEIWDKYNEFVQNQLVELSDNYGDIDILWLDGGWVNKDNNEFLDMDNIISQVHENQPDMLIVDRTIGGKYEHYVTPERSIPDVLPKKVWESNIPLAKNWGYVPNDIYKPFSEILDTMIKIVSLGGNVIFGVGPKPDGELPDEALLIMHQLGAWLKINGEAIYKTRPFDGPIIEGIYFTQNSDSIFAFVKGKSVPKILLDFIGNRQTVNLNKSNSENEYSVIKIEKD